MTLRSAATVPPIRLLSEAEAPPVMRMPLELPAATVPVTFVPRKFPATTLFDEPRRMARPGARLMTNPRIVLPELPACRSSVLAPPDVPSISMTGPAPAIDRGWVVVSRTTAPVMAGSAEASWMRYQLRAAPTG